jgi:hypothetical protein
MTAMEKAELARESFTQLGKQEFVFSEFNSEAASVRLGSFFFSRDVDTVTSSKALVDYFDWDRPLAQAWHAADLANSYRGERGLKVPDSTTLPVRDALLAAAQRDGIIAEDELEIVRRYCFYWSIEGPSQEATTKPSGFELIPGMKICLTGEPSKTSGDSELRKSYLRQLIDENGLEEVQSVTISRCDLVVAFSSSSMSGKAKKARELGKPLISAQEFVALITRLGESA